MICGLTRVLLALPLVLPCFLCAQSSHSLTVRGQLARLGYEQIQLRQTAENHLYLAGKLNGHRRSVLVDTGWSFTTVSTNTAANLPSCSPTGAIKDNCVLIENLTLSRVSFSGLPARVQHMVFNGQATPFDVVLGCDFLRQHFAIIDCPGHRLYTRPAPSTEKETNELEVTLRQGGFKDIPLELKQPLAITCQARINGQPVELLLDTGAVWSSLDVRLIRRLGLRALPTPARITGVGTTGIRGLEMAEVDHFAFGDVAMKSTSFALMDLRDWGLAAPGSGLSEVKGIFGGSDLLACDAVIDCQRLKLWVRRGRMRR
jgi:hypothetical protein